MTIRWITPLLGTAPAADVQDDPDVSVVDVRDLVDKVGNNLQFVESKVSEGVKSLLRGARTVVCCDYGMSRSNAIAVGILVRAQNLSFDDALRLVESATGETQIKLGPLTAVRDALGLSAKRQPDKRRRSILITGGSGFVGTSLRSALGSEYAIVAPPREQLDIGLGTTQVDMLVGQADVDCLVHLANPRVCTSNLAMGQSLVMLRNAIDVCLARNISMVYLSGWEVYSGYAGALLADESTPAFPRGPYGEAKHFAELMIERASQVDGFRCALLRSSPVYGQGSDKPKFIRNFLAKAMRGQPITTHRYRSGAAALDLLHISDLVSALSATLRSEFVGTLNLGTGVATSTFAIAEMLRDRLGSESPISQVDIHADVAAISMNWQRARGQLQWEPTTPLSAGLDQILAENTVDAKNQR